MTLKNDRDISTLVREIEKQKESKMESLLSSSQKVLKANEKYEAKEKERTKQKQLM